MVGERVASTLVTRTSKGSSPDMEEYEVVPQEEQLDSTDASTTSS